MQSEVPRRFVSVTNALWIPGRILFSLTIVALGFETIVCARVQGHFLGSGPAVVPCLPWLPAIPMVAGIAGSIWAICGMGLLAPRGSIAPRVLGTLFVLCTLVTILPRCLMDPANILLRTALFEPLALAGIALLQPGRYGDPRWPELLGRILLGLSLVVFGLNLLLALDLAAFLPAWIPSHERWIEVYAGALALGGVCVWTGLLRRWVPAALGVMFGAVALTVYLPRVLGFYSVANAAQDPNEWSNLLVSIGLCGGMWTLVRRYVREKKVQERPIYAGGVTGGSRRHLS